jgi:Tol biopolymer transport system component
MSDRPDRLDSWKEIAAYLNRDVTTVQRWEKREGMPVHRHVHDKMGSVYASRMELDAWTRSRTPGVGAEQDSPVEPAADSAAETRPGRTLVWLAAGLLAFAAAAGVWQLQRRDVFWTNPVGQARFVKVTDFPGTEQAAAISRDGRFVAFLSDCDGRMDVWVTQVGTGQFHNVTRNDAREFINPSVRTLGFSPDGSLVTFWVRRPDGPNASDISIWAMPILGGPLRPYLEGAAEFDWSADGARLAYHTTGPGDPMFVREAGETRDDRPIFTAPAGLHSHYPVWSPDGQFLYFVQGSLPDHLDIWRIRSTGGNPERITRHDAYVSHPAFVDSRTLMYLASESDGAGPWLFSVDVERRLPHRVSSGTDRYTSLAASADGKRIVVTQANRKGTLWRVPIAEAPVDASLAKRVPLTTGTGFCPRSGPGYLVYVSSKASGDSIWKTQGETTTEVWSAPDARIIGCPAIAPDGGRVTFSVGHSRQSLLYVVNLDGTSARVVANSLDLQGSPAWTPDGRSITTAGLVGGVPHLFSVALDAAAAPPVEIIRQHSVDPVWSPDGRFVAFSGADIGTTFPVSAVTVDAQPYPLPRLTLTRGARRLCFLPGRQALVLLRGGIGHKDLWVVDLATGAERQLTSFAPDFEVRDFDLSPDGREVIVEQVQDQSDIVLLDMSQR